MCAFRNRGALLNWNLVWEKSSVQQVSDQSNTNKSGCCLWMSVCTWILHSFITGTSRNKVKAFNMLNSWHSLRTACIPDLFFPKWDKGIFLNMLVWHWLQSTNNETLWRNPIDRVMEMILLGSFGADLQKRDF